MQQQSDELTEVLNDLVRINNDRIEGYHRAIDEATPYNSELRSMFDRMIEQSVHNKEELTELIASTGGKPDVEGSTNSGKIYRIWMDLKAAIKGKTDHTILASCEYGEDAAQRAYEDALESEVTVGPEVRILIRAQKAALKESHDLIKHYRDAVHEGK